MSRPFYPNQSGNQPPGNRHYQDNSTTGGPPPSYKTNVNRAKTKRWVEAKSYSYDGDDWGDVDDYDEYGGYDEPVAPPKPTGFRQQGQSASPTASRGYGALERTNSFDRGDERRAFSAAGPRYDIQNVPGQSLSREHPLASGSMGRDKRHTTEQPRSQQPYPTPGNVQNRSSFDSQSHTPAPSYSPPSNYRGVSYSEQPRPGYGSRAQSMTSNSSSVDFHSRRDFTPSAMPQPLSTRASPAPRVTGDFVAPPRKSSLSQQNPAASEPSQTFHQASSLSEGSPILTRERTESNASKPLPFVRPADIYRRMQEERERERQSQDSSRPSMDVIMGSQPTLDNRTDLTETEEYQPKPSNPSPLVAKGRTRIDLDEAETGGLRTKTPLNTVAERKSEYGTDGLSDRPFLPDVARVSGFGESFLGSLESIDQPQSSNAESRDSQQTSQSAVQANTEGVNLTHQNSLGFRSLVQQAFDRPEDQIPPTPSSAAGSTVVRSDSEGTNAISPIISRTSSATHKNNRSETRENNIPIIAEEAAENSPRPTSSETLSTPKAVTRKASPIISPRPDSSESISSSFMPSHRRQISTPSPNNSPAKTATKEVENIQVPQPQEAEIATATPTTPYVSDSIATASKILAYNDLPGLHEGKPSGVSLRLDTINSSNQIAELSTQSAAKPSAAQSSILQSEPSKRSESPITMDSPAKSRVRDLAGKFGDVSPTRRGSEQSLQQNNIPASISSKLEDPFVPRPTNDRMQSFRPNLPGGWESYASATPASQSSTPVEGNRNDPMTVEQISEYNDLPSGSSPHGNEIDEDIHINPTTVKRTLSKAPKHQESDGPFSAVAAAGTALAGALVAAVGMNQEEPEELSPPQAEEFNAARGRSASLKGTKVYPNTSQVWTNNFDDSVSSVAPTPLAKDTPRALNDSPTSNSEYFAPVVPLKQRPRNISTSVAESAIPIRPQILPSLSTDPSPQDYESDRLRKEIVRELSPHSERFEDDYGHSPQPSMADGGRLSAVQTTRSQGHDSIGLPREYESYWNATPIEEHTSDLLSNEPTESSQISTSPPDEDLSSADKEVNDKVTAGLPTSNYLQVRPEFTHRFSWEPEPEEINTSSTPTNATITSDAQAQPQLSDLLQTLPNIRSPSMQASATNKETLRDLTDVSEMYDEIARLTDNDTPVSSSKLQYNRSVPAEQVPSEMLPLPSQDNVIHRDQEGITRSYNLPLSSDQAKIPPFREIIALKTAEERINALNSTREQFAHMNSGLSNWITATINDFPEHSSLLNNGGQFTLGNSVHKSSPSRSKLAGLRLSSLQPLQQPYYQQYLNASSQPVPSSPTSSAPVGTGNASSSTPTPSGGSGGKLTKEQVRAKSKDLVHSAGVFGGKANNAAKGLFSKGKNKFRGNGGDKAPTPYPHNPELLQQETTEIPQVQPQYRGPITSALSLGHPTLQDQTTSSRLKGQTPPTSLPLFEDSPSQPQQKPQFSLPVLFSQKSLTEDHDIGRLSTSLTRHDSFHPNAINLRDQGFPGAATAIEGDPVSPQHAPHIQSNEMKAIDSQSPRSTSSGNKTPTQASYTGNQWLPENMTLLGQASSQVNKHKNESQSDMYSNENAPHMVQELSQLGAAEPNRILEAAPSPRISEDSHSTFITAESGAEQSLPNDHVEFPVPPKPSYSHQPSLPDVDFKRQDNDQRLEHSFSEYNKPFSAMPSEDLSDRPSFDNNSTLRVQNRPPSPVSPQQLAFNQPDSSGPVHYNTSYDFGPDDSQSFVGHRRPRSFSRPFIDPNEHPAFREDHPRDSNEPPTKYCPPDLSRDETVMARQQITEHHLEGAGPPPVETNPKVRSTSRGAAFLKRLSGPPREATPKPVDELEKQNGSSTSPAEAVAEKKKKKRGSLFRSLTEQNGSDTIRSKPNSVSPPSRSRTELQHNLPRRSDTGLTLNKDNVAKSHGKLQRASTSGPTKQDGAKKKRFSSFGTIFGRSNQKPPVGPMSSLQTQEQVLFNEQQPRNSYNTQPLALHQESIHNPNYPKQASPSSHIHPTHKSDYHHPPLEGYYSPDRRSGTFSSDFINAQQSPGLMPQNHESPGYAELSSPRIDINLANAHIYQEPSSNHQQLLDSQNKYPTRTTSRQPVQSSPRDDRYAHRAQAPAPTSRSNYSTWERPPNERLDNLSTSQTSSCQPSSSNTNVQSIETRSPTRMPSRLSMKKPREFHEVQSTSINRTNSPPPPPPPPKDEWLTHSPHGVASAHARSQSHNPSLRTSFQQPIPHENDPAQPNHHYHHRHHQSLSPLQTNTAPPSTTMSRHERTLTPEEVRKARQREIETGHRNPRFNSFDNGNDSSDSGANGAGSRPGMNSEDEKIVMSGSSYPGQMWQPDYAGYGYGEN